MLDPCDRLFIGRSPWPVFIAKLRIKAIRDLQIAGIRGLHAGSVSRRKRQRV